MNLNLNKKNKKGFAMLFAVLTSSLLISIGVSIFSISLKELMISASIRDSQTANYAAESAYECFKYWDLFSDTGAFSPVSTSTDAEGKVIDVLKGNSTDVNIVCNGIPTTITLVKQGSSYVYDSGNSPFFKYSSSVDSTQPESSFKFIVNSSGCTDDVGNREICSGSQSSYRSTSIFSGYNTSQSGRRVERSYIIEE